MKNIIKCPVCGCEEIEKGNTYGEGSMFPIKSRFKSGSEVIADICTNCGHILSMRVSKPEKFKP
ncbi:transcription initiation factor TFIIIB [Senegalia massiliensis]|uniref:Transcription initiation factor TFIIIB n=1 Tax=Senegalia massiliensis TaxID=1720316 RepID=A0A845R3J6_9CLOT|nr:transcription initiation factor TFIIIB [Senegalia massiliensis]